MSGKEMHFQVPPKAFRLKLLDWESLGAKCTKTNTQFATAGQTEISVVRNFWDCHSSRRGTLELSTKDTDEQSGQASTTKWAQINPLAFCKKV